MARCTRGRGSRLRLGVLAFITRSLAAASHHHHTTSMIAQSYELCISFDLCGVGVLLDLALVSPVSHRRGSGTP